MRDLFSKKCYASFFFFVQTVRDSDGFFMAVELNYLTGPIYWIFRRNLGFPEDRIPRGAESALFTLFSRQIPRFARHKRTAPTAWKIKLGNHMSRCGAYCGCEPSDWPTS